MFRAINRKIKFLKYRLNHPKDSEEEVKDKPLESKLTKNLDKCKEIFGSAADLQFHAVSIGSVASSIMYIDGLINMQVITDAILLPISKWNQEKKPTPSSKEWAKTIQDEILCNGETKAVQTYEQVTSDCLNGNTILFIDGCSFAISISTKGWQQRSVTEPQSESVVRGPREGFIENIRTNTSLIRRKIKSEFLRIENMIVGDYTRTNIALMYIDGIVNPEVLDKVRTRIKQIKADAILETGMLEEYIEDFPFSPFSTVGYSEKPDVVAANILEGRVAIVVDGTPFVLTVPLLFIETFQSAEDYYGRTVFTSVIRIVRYLAYFISVLGPAIFLALTTFHQGLIPTRLLITIIDAREGTAFPVLIEMLIMLFAFEIMREAGIRLPRPMGQAISIVGALVMGDAAVSAGLVGAPVVITVAITAVSTFLVPMQNETIPILRVLLLFLASVAGLYGVVFGGLGILIHMASITSFGVPYSNAFTKYNQDALIRYPLWKMKKRPKPLAQDNIVRRGETMQDHSAHQFEQEHNIGVKK